jgi:hypothetical protein
VRPLRELAIKSWALDTQHAVRVRRAFFLDNQLERVKSWKFSNEHPRRHMEGGYDVDAPPTRAYLFRDLVLMDGHLYKGGSCEALHPKTRLLPFVHVGRMVDRAAIYSSDWGLQWFGAWLLVDCLTYKLAETVGTPVAPDYAIWRHTEDYEHRLSMCPLRMTSSVMCSAVVFDDRFNNRGRAERSASVRAQLLSHAKATPHPGVFILRGVAERQRRLVNELELADQLRRARGFRVVDPEQMSVGEIISVCAGARTVIGVEGSQLIHGVAVLEETGNVLTLQPPERFVCDFKHRTDRDNQNFGFVVGTPVGGGFRVDAGEVERTLDLFPECAP